MKEIWVQSLSREDPLEKEMATHSIFLPGESHGQRGPMGPWGRKQSDPTQRLTLTPNASECDSEIASLKKKIN